jgi:hypothetical protein
MKFSILVISLLLSSVSLAATNCDAPLAPSIPDQDLSKRQERQLNRDVLRFFERSQQYVVCVQNLYKAAKADNASESRLLELVAANDSAVKKVDGVAAIYEERIGPITELVQRRRVANSASGRRDPWAGRPWPGTDPYRFPPPLVVPPAFSNGSGGNFQ